MALVTWSWMNKWAEHAYSLIRGHSEFPWLNLGMLAWPIVDRITGEGKMHVAKVGFVPLVGSLVAALALVPTTRAADQDELTVMTSVALTSALDELKPVFEREDKAKLTITYDLISNLRKRVMAGESADVIILSRPVMEDLEKEGKVAPGTLFEVASTSVAVAARAGAPKPDISTGDAFKKTLLAAKSIVYADPAKGGASGVYFRESCRAPRHRRSAQRQDDPCGRAGG